MAKMSALFKFSNIRMRNHCILSTNRGAGQTRRFGKRDKSADFENETKPPISKMRQNRRFCKSEQIAIKIVSLIKASWPNYLHYAIILPITIRK